jgi:hypothetical protein
MVAIGGDMGHLVGQVFRHGQTATMETEKSDEDLATREINKSYRLASRGEKFRISTSLCLPIPNVIHDPDFIVRQAAGEISGVEPLKSKPAGINR